MNGISELLKRRSAAIESLMKSLEHLPRESQFTILTSFMSIDDLERIAKIQDKEMKMWSTKQSEYDPESTFLMYDEHIIWIIKKAPCHKAVAQIKSEYIAECLNKNMDNQEIV
jgi:hypothetical protein